MKRYLRLLVTSLGIIGIITILSLIYGLVTHRAFTARYIFDANFLVGTVLIAAGVIYMLIPSSILPAKKDPLYDHTTFVERSFKARRRKQTIAVDMLAAGFFMVLVTGIIEIMIHAIF